MRFLRSPVSVLACAVLFITACGDSTGPTDRDTTAALHSLALGMQSESFANLGIGFPLTIDESFDGIAPYLNQLTVNVGGSQQAMFALGLHVSLPPGTCSEDIFGHSPHAPGACTPPRSFITLVLWQSHSATAPPDQIMLLTADIGTNCFNDCPSGGSNEAFAEFLWEHEMWYSRLGPLTNSVSATTTPCSIPLPNYAKSGVCSVAALNLEGKITFGNFVDEKTLTMTIARQTIHGVWMSVTEVLPCNC